MLTRLRSSFYQATLEAAIFRECWALGTPETCPMPHSSGLQSRINNCSSSDTPPVIDGHSALSRPHQWTIAAHVENNSPEVMQRRIEAIELNRYRRAYEARRRGVSPRWKSRLGPDRNRASRLRAEAVGNSPTMLSEANVRFQLRPASLLHNNCAGVSHKCRTRIQENPLNRATSFTTSQHRLH
jgi:hypothetical protein